MSEGFKPGDRIVIEGQGKDGPVRHEGTVDFFDNDLARAAGVVPQSGNGGTRIAPGADPGFRDGWDAIFGNKEGEPADEE